MDFMDGVILLLIAAVAIGFGLLWWKNKQEKKKVPADPVAPTLKPFAPEAPPITATQAQAIFDEELVRADATRIAKQIFGTPVPPVRIFPDSIYTSIEALLIDLRSLHFKHQVVVDNHLIWPIGEAGFGPPLTYAYIAGNLVQVNSALPGSTSPVTPAPPPPVPVQPPPPVQPPHPDPYGLTADEIRAGVQFSPPYHAKTDGERFPSHEARAAWVAAVLGQGQGGSTPVEVAPNYVDTRGWNHNHWLWFLAHPEVWPRVENTLYNNQMKNRHSQGGDLNVGGEPVKPDNL